MWVPGGRAFEPVLTSAQIYLVCLSLCFSFKNRWNRLADAHARFVLLLLWSVFVYRDVWPLALSTMHPADQTRGLQLWIDFGVLTVAAVFVPILLPTIYVPCNPEVSHSRMSLLHIALN